jgi:ribonuclease Y
MGTTLSAVAIKGSNVHFIHVGDSRIYVKFFGEERFQQITLDHSLAEVEYRKGNITEKEGAHALIGAEMARRAGEDPMVVNMIAAHHYDKDPESLEAIIVQIADAISASRPGSRKETLDAYIKRLEHIEGIAKQFSGVEKAYSIQAGRELRVIVSSDEVSDEEMETLARGIAKRIESELKYPGIIKVTVIREKRIVEYAK